MIFNPATDLLEFAPVSHPPSQPATPQSVFPPPDIFGADRISVAALQATGIPLEHKVYASLGGGMGSFVWTDYTKSGYRRLLLRTGKRQQATGKRKNNK